MGSGGNRHTGDALKNTDTLVTLLSFRLILITNYIIDDTIAQYCTFFGEHLWCPKAPESKLVLHELSPVLGLIFHNLLREGYNVNKNI